MKVSKSEAAKDARAAQGKIAALEEDLVAKDKALKEAQSRQADLEKNLKELRKVVELKNQSLAELQKQAEAKAVPAPRGEKAGGACARQGAETVPAVPAPAVAEKPAEKPAEPAKPVESEKPAEAAKPDVAAKPIEAPKPVEAPKPAPGRPFRRPRCRSRILSMN